MKDERAKRFLLCVSPLRTAKFWEKGRRAGGGLKNDDLLIASKVRSNRFTDDKRRPPKFRLAVAFAPLFPQKVEHKKVSFLFHTTLKGKFPRVSHLFALSSFIFALLRINSYLCRL